MSHDYIMRQIEDMARFFASVIFARRPAGYSVFSEDGSVSEASLLHLRLRALLAEGDVNAAENLLYDTIAADPRDEYLPVALDFYENLNAKTDAELAAESFSRQEIAEGMAGIKRFYEPLAGE